MQDTAQTTTTDDTQTPVFEIPGVTVASSRPKRAGDAASAMRDLAAQSSSLSRQMGNITRSMSEQQAPVLQDIEAAAKALGDVKTPKYESTPNPPSVEMRTLSAGAVIAALAVGALVGRRQGRPFYGAAAALSGAYDAFNKNDHERAQREIDQYKMNVEAINQRNQEAQRAYQDALNAAKTDVEAGRVRLEAIQQAYFPQMQAAKFEQANIKQQIDLIGKMVGMQQKTAELAIRAGEAAQAHNDRMAALDEKRREFGAQGGPEGKAFATAQGRVAGESYANTLAHSTATLLGYPDAAVVGDNTSIRNLHGLVSSYNNLASVVKTLSDPAERHKLTMLQQGLAQLGTRASSLAGIEPSEDDSTAVAETKSILRVLANQAMQLAGSRGLTVSALRISNDVLKPAMSSPQALLKISKNLLAETRNQFPVLEVTDSQGHLQKVPAKWDELFKNAQTLPQFYGQFESPSAPSSEPSVIDLTQ